MADKKIKPEIVVKDDKGYSDNVAPEYKNYSSVARKPFDVEADKSKAESEDKGTTGTNAPSTPKAPGK